MSDVLLQVLTALCVIVLAALVSALLTSVLAHAAATFGAVRMILHCPMCRTQHIDGSYRARHKSHLCDHCGCIWRPADICTEGIATIETRGKNDTYPGVSNGPDGSE